MAMSAGTAYVTVVPEMSGFATGVGKGINKIGNQLTRTGRVLTRGITIPVAAAAAVSVKMALDFENSMKRVGSLTEASAGQVKKWSDEILQLGPKLGVAPNDFAQALYFVASSGAKVAQVMPITTEAVKLAAAGMGDAETVAQILTSAVNAYGASNLSAAQAADVLTEAIKVGKAEPAALASALGRVIPLAQAMGVTFAEAAASVSTLTNTGLSAAEATTALRAVLTTMVKPAQQTKEEYKKLGFSVGQLQKNIAEHGLNDTLMMMKKRIGDNKDALGKLFPNVRALTGFLALTGKNAAQVARNVDLVTHSTGVANKAFRTAAKTDAFKFQQALAAIQSQAVQLGVALLPVVTDLLGHLEGLMQAFDGLSSAQKEWIIGGLLVAATIGPIVTLLGNMTIILGGVVRGASLLGAAFFSLAGAQAATATATAEATAQMVLFDAAAAPVIGSLTLIATGLSIIVGIGVIAYFMTGAQAASEFGDSEREARAATDELTDALARQKTGTLDLRQATVDRTLAAKQLAKDEREQAAFTKKHGHEDHALATQIEQDSINLARAKGRQGIAEQDLADVRHDLRTATVKLLQSQQDAGKQAIHEANILTRQLGPALLYAHHQTKLNTLQKKQASIASGIFIKQMGHEVQGLAATAGGMSKAQKQAAVLDLAAQHVALSINDIPTKHQIEVYLKNHGADVRNEINNIASQLASLHDKQINILIATHKSKARAAGGPVAANTPYLVGERGPELFVPNNGGNIVPNHSLTGGGGRTRANIYIEDGPTLSAWIEDIADGSVGRNSNLNRQKRRMSR